MTLNANPLLLGDDGGYNLTRSLRFRSSASAYLTRTPTTTSNRTTWTWSGWIKRGALSGTYGIFGAGTDNGTNRTLFWFTSSDTLIYQEGGSNLRTTNAVYRDPAAWGHLVVVVDNGNATAANRIQIYFNGVLQTTTGSGDPGSTQMNLSGVAMKIGTRTNPPTSEYFDGYMAEVNFIDGQALAPSSFGSFSPYNQWLPKKYAGTYGTNGFYLPFTNNASAATLGNDFSGNSNNWTTNNISVTTGSTYDSTTDVPTLTSATAANFATLNPNYIGRSTLSNGNLTASGTTDLPTIIPDSGTYYFEIDGVSKTWTPPASFPSAAGSYNFGQQPFVNTPTAQRLNTFNLASSIIPDGRVAMAATLYTGTGAAQTISNAVNGVSFQPDFVWAKSRSSAESHRLEDSVRGATKALYSNLTNAEATEAQSITAFGSTGFTLGTGTPNTSAVTYVGWQWKAGGTAVSNTAGSITSQVSANTTAGFSVVTYASTTGTVGHGLGVAPSMVIMKSRNVADQWTVYHVSKGNTIGIPLNSTGAGDVNSGFWNNTSPTSTVFSQGSWNSGYNKVAYCFAPVAGYSAFGSYVGNGSTDGVFVYLGFRARWLLIKETGNANSWELFDTSRDPYNISSQRLFPNDSAAEATTASLDILSNGIKFRVGNTGINRSGGTYIYAAFAENPFKYANAR